MTGPPETPMERRKRVRKRNLKIGGILAGAVALVVFSYKFYFEEYNAYRNAVTSESLFDVEEYLYRYPDGRWLEEVNDHIEQIHFTDAKKDYEITQNSKSWDAYFDVHDSGKNYAEALTLYEEACYKDIVYMVEHWVSDSGATSSPFPWIEKFRAKYDESKYSAQVDSLYAQGWAYTREVYNETIRKKYDQKKGFKFFKKAMDYMEANEQSKVYIHFGKWDAKLKDWDEYSSTAKNYLDELTEMANESPFRLDFLNPKSPPPTENPPTSAKNYVLGDYRSGQKDNFIDQLIVNLGEIYNGIPFKFVQASEGAITEDHVSFYIDCKIRNQEYGSGSYTYPNLYSITTTSNFMTRTFDGYIFGIEAQCTVSGKIPGESKEFKDSFTGDPGSSFDDITGVSGAYDKLLMSIFGSMADEFSESLGLAPGKGGFSWEY